MRRVVFFLSFVLALAPVATRADDDLQQSFTEGMLLLEEGKIAEAETVFRGMLSATQSPRVKLELARALYLEGKYAESKALFKEVALQDETPWPVRDNIALFVRQIEDKTGYLKFGLTVVSDSNPRNLAAQKEFTVAGLKVTPTEAPQKMWGLRYAARGWLPISEPIRIAGYAAASYVDFPGADFDRLTVDAGLAKSLSNSGRVRGKAGVEFGTMGGKSLYQLPYVGLDNLIAEAPKYRVASELKLGRLRLPDFSYQDATLSSAAISVRHAIAPTAAATLRTGLEYSRAAERPYSYYGWDLTPGLNWLSIETAYYLGLSASLGRRVYSDVDPLFGERRSDSRTRLEISVGNKKWRWRQANVVVTGSLEENRSNIEFFSYRKANLSVAIE